MSDTQIIALLKSNELLVNELIELRAEAEAVREVMIRVCDKLQITPPAEPAFVDDLIRKAKSEHQTRLAEKLKAIAAAMRG